MGRKTNRYVENLVADSSFEAQARGQLLEAVRILLGEASAALDASSADIAQALEWVTVRRGEPLFAQGDAADSLYVIVHGLLRVVVSGEDGEIVVNELGRGDTVGEMGLLSGEPRSASVIAVRDSALCRFSKPAFERLVEQHPAVMTRIAVQMVQRLRRLSHAQRGVVRPLTVALLPASEGVSGFVARLAAACGALGPTRHLSRSRVGEMPVTGDLDAEADSPELVAWLNAQEQQARFIFYEADLTDTAWTRRCLQQCDRVVIVAQAGASPQLATVEALLTRGQQAHVRPRTELVLLHPNTAQMPHHTAAWLALCPIEQHYHVAEDTPAHLARLVRFLSGQAVGLVLGAGGMRGSTHIGVLRALAELAITPDYVGGCSAGALIAAQVALGWDTETMYRVGERELVQKKALTDFTLPLVAFNSGRRLTRALKTMLGDVRIEDLWLPYFCVSGNMTTAQMEVHRRGLLWRYVRASTALPGVYPPVLDESGDLLVDGSIFNNVPADVMRRFVGDGTVIAVDVGRELSGKRHFRFGDSVSGWSLLLERLTPFGRKRRVPGILRILTRTTALNGVAARTAQVAQADLLLKPPIEDFGLFDMKGYEAIYAIGYRDTLEKAGAWLKEKQT